MKTGPETEGVMQERAGGWSLCWFYTHAHATTDQSAEIAPDTRHAADKADKNREMRGVCKAVEAGKERGSGGWSSVSDGQQADGKRRV